MRTDDEAFVSSAMAKFIIQAFSMLMSGKARGHVLSKGEIGSVSGER